MKRQTGRWISRDFAIFSRGLISAATDLGLVEIGRG